MYQKIGPTGLRPIIGDDVENFVSYDTHSLTILRRAHVEGVEYRWGPRGDGSYFMDEMDSAGTFHPVVVVDSAFKGKTAHAVSDILHESYHWRESATLYTNIKLADMIERPQGKGVWMTKCLAELLREEARVIIKEQAARTRFLRLLNIDIGPPGGSSSAAMEALCKDFWEVRKTRRQVVDEMAKLVAHDIGSHSRRKYWEMSHQWLEDYWNGNAVLPTR